jgi:hypothetical protein
MTNPGKVGIAGIALGILVLALRWARIETLDARLDALETQCRNSNVEKGSRVRDSVAGPFELVCERATLDDPKAAGVQGQIATANQQRRFWDDVTPIGLAMGPHALPARGGHRAAVDRRNAGLIGQVAAPDARQSQSRPSSGFGLDLDCALGI